MGNTGIEFNCENEQYFLKKTNQSLLEELFIVKKQQNVVILLKELKMKI